MHEPIKVSPRGVTKPSATSDSQIGYTAGSAASDNLASIMKNNQVIFENRLTLPKIVLVPVKLEKNPSSFE
ncbi:MAG: hypothetical protein ACE15F_20320 [bacterium]